jgi:Transcription factor WhiB.
VTARTPWRERAACRGMPTELFFSDKRRDQLRALAICAVCPVREPCLREAMRAEAKRRYDRHGVYGGLTARGRELLARQESAA